MGGMNYIGGAIGEKDPEYAKAHLETSHAETACGLTFIGRRAVRHPVWTGGAFDCDTCKRAWEKATKRAAS